MAATMTADAARVIGSDLDTLLAPLDDLARGPAVAATPHDTERAYALGVLAIELIGRPSNRNLLRCCAHYGVPADDALTIARAISGALLRIAAAVGSSNVQS